MRETCVPRENSFRDQIRKSGIQELKEIRLGTSDYKKTVLLSMPDLPIITLLGLSLFPYSQFS